MAAMARVFVSHSSRDSETAAELKAWLVEPWRHAAEVTHIAVEPGRERVATATEDGRIGVWDSASGAAVDVGASLNLKNTRQLSWGPSGTVLLAVSWSGIVLWDAAANKRWSSDEGADRAWFSPDGRRFVTPARDSGLLWTPETDGSLKSEPVPQGQGRILAAAFRRDGADILTLSGRGVGRDDGSYSVYGVSRVPTILTLSRLDSSTDDPNPMTLTLGNDLFAAAFTPDGKLLATLSGTPSGSGRGEKLEPDTTVRLWNVEIGGERFARTLPGSKPALSRDGKFVVAIDGSAAYLRRTADDGSNPADPLRYEARIVSAAFSPDGATLALLTDDKTIRLQSLSAGVGGAARVIKAPSAGALGFSIDGHLLWAEGGYGIANVWEAGTGKSVFPTGPAECRDTSDSQLDPAGRILLRFCGDDHVNVWTRRDDHFEGPVSVPLPHAARWRVAASPTTGVVAVTIDDVVEIWDAGAGGRRHRIELGASAGRVAFAPDGSTIAVADDDGGLSIVDAATGKVRSRRPVGNVRELAFAAHGRLVLTAHEVFGQDGILNIWPVDGGDRRSTIPLRRGELKWALDATEQTLITWSDRSTRLWSVDAGEELFTASFDHPPVPGSSPGEVETAAITRDGAYLITATGSETRLWAIAGGSLRQTLRATVGGCLSSAFRETVLGEAADGARSAHEHCLETVAAAPGSGVRLSPAP
jgi:WD40 repeat protein